MIPLLTPMSVLFIIPILPGRIEMDILYTLALHQYWCQTLLLSFVHISHLSWTLHTTYLWWSLFCREFRNVVIYTRGALYGCYRKLFLSLWSLHSTVFSIPGIVLESVVGWICVIRKIFIFLSWIWPVLCEALGRGLYIFCLGSLCWILVWRWTVVWSLSNFWRGLCFLSLAV